MPYLLEMTVDDVASELAVVGHELSRRETPPTVVDIEAAVRARIVINGALPRLWLVTLVRAVRKAVKS